MIKRIIARLDIKNNFLVKGKHLEGLRILGYPELFAKKYFDEARKDRAWREMAERKIDEINNPEKYEK